MDYHLYHARDSALIYFSLVGQRTCSGVLEQVIWLLWELVGRNDFSTFVFPALVSASYFVFLSLILVVVECLF